MAQIRPQDLANYIKNKTEVAADSTLKKWKKAAKPLAKSLINEYIDKGVSPVAGQGKFQSYTPEYAKKQGKPRTPVDLNAKGRMRKSLVGQNTNAGIKLFYTSPIAKYHNGEGRVDRLIIPTKTQKFKRSITSALSKLYVKLFKIK